RLGASGKKDGDRSGLKPQDRGRDEDGNVRAPSHVASVTVIYGRWHSEPQAATTGPQARATARSRRGCVQARPDLHIHDARLARRTATEADILWPTSPAVPRKIGRESGSDRMGR